jgi:peptidoglycan L-alanyl-D-glutamate endopeptidase CwlK
MPLGKASQVRLQSCHPKLRRLVEETMIRLDRRRTFDFSVVCGHRNQAAQEAAVASGASKLHWPESRHNTLPSTAVDLAPYPYDPRDLAAHARLAGYVLAVADELDIEVRWGGDWDGDGKSRDERLLDCPHFELTTRELNRP